MTNTTPPPVDPGPTTGPADQPGPTAGPRTSRAEVMELGRLRRTHDDRHIAGVAGGLARHLDIDPIIVRVALVVLVFFGGAGLLLYGAVWVLAPEEGSSAQPLGLDDRNRNIALMGAGVLAALAAVGDFAGAFWFPWPLVIIGLLVVWFLNNKQERGQQPSTYASAQPPWQDSATTYTATNYTATDYTPSQQGWQMPGVEANQQSTHQPPNQPWQAYTYARPRNPRKRGPILFWFTLALVATGIGTLGLIDVSGTSVADAAYPALATALIGAMLLLGAFWGRAGGLIFLGLIAVVATLGATASDNVEHTPVVHAPTSAADVRDSYDFSAGDFTVDLSGVTDVEDLDGRELSIDAGLGDLEVIVPDGMDVSIEASAGAGDVTVLGERSEGLGVTQEGFVDGGDEVPDMRISIDLGAGQVNVREK